MLYTTHCTLHTMNNNTTNKLLERIQNTTIPNLQTDVLFNDFANYFINKIDKIYDKLTIKKTKLINLTKKTYDYKCCIIYF